MVDLTPSPIRQARAFLLSSPLCNKKMDEKLKIDICKCDVANKEALALFRSKFSEWKTLVFESTASSISKQIDHLLWNDTVFRTFNETRKITLQSDTDDFGFNMPLLDLFDEGFVAIQVMGIRRLTDPKSYNPKKQVVSLTSILIDIKANLDLFTRENYICFDGTSFAGDLEKSDRSKYFHWECRQKNFDRLSGVKPENRSRNDVVSNSIISKHIQNLKVCDSIRTYANKFIAHAADSESIESLNAEQKFITLDKLDECYKSILSSASFIGCILLYQNPIDSVPTPQYDQLKNLAKPMISKENLNALYEFWHRRVKEIDNWDKDYWPDA